MEEDVLAKSSEVFEKTLTLKSLEKQVNEKLALIGKKLDELERDITLIKKAGRR